MIKNPRQIMLIALGVGMCNLGGKSSHASATTSSNSSDTYTTNTSTNTSYNTTDNNTNTVTQDRRLVNDRGIGVSADNSTVVTRDSNNSTNNYSSIVSATDHGAVAMAGQIVASSVASNHSLASQTVDASKYLADTGYDMLRANLTYAENLSEGGMDFALQLTRDSQAEARNAIREVTAASGNALNQVVAIASKPLNANDPQRLVIIVALGVVGLVFFSKMRA